MTNKVADHDQQSAENLRSVFEAAVCEVRQPEIAIQRRMPIVQRRPIPASPDGAEKRALTDAARALARLWKISSNPAR